MQSMSVQEFTKSPQVALSMLSKNGNTVLTRNGKPSVLLIKTDSKHLEKIYDFLQHLEFTQNMAEMQAISKKNGNSKMSMKQINELIKDARKAG